MKEIIRTLLYEFVLSGFGVVPTVEIEISCAPPVDTTISHSWTIIVRHNEQSIDCIMLVSMYTNRPSIIWYPLVSNKELY